MAAIITDEEIGRSASRYHSIGITLMMVANAALILLLRQQIRDRAMRPATALNF